MSQFRLHQNNNILITHTQKIYFLSCILFFLPSLRVIISHSKLMTPAHLHHTVFACLCVSQGCRLEAGCSWLDGTHACDGPGQSGLREIGRQNLWWDKRRQDRTSFTSAAALVNHFTLSSPVRPHPPPLYYSSIPRWPNPRPSKQFVLKQTCW